MKPLTKKWKCKTWKLKLAEKHIKDANEEIAEKIKVLDTAKKQIANKEGVLNNKKGELQKIIADTEIEENAI